MGIRDKLQDVKKLVILRVKVIPRSYVKYFIFYPESYLVLNPENTLD